MFEILAAKGMHYLLEIVHDWKRDYHVNDKGDIVFQNKALLNNIRFNNNSLHEITNHSSGFENLPETVQDPDEVWSVWGDERQRIVLRNYIKFGSDSAYIVQTKDGLVVDAFAMSLKQTDKYRKGILISQ